MEESLASRNPERVAAVKARIAATRKAALIGSPEEKRTTSRLGGLPDLPSTLTWPCYDDKAMTFLAQVDLSQLPRNEGIAWLPPSGFLFYFAGQRWDEYVEEASAVLYSDQLSLQPRSAPPGVPVSTREQSIRFEIKDTYAGPSGYDYECNDDDNNDIDLWYYKLIPNFRLWQIGGWPRQIQDHDLPLRAEQRYRGATHLYRGQEGEELDLELSSWDLLGQFAFEDLFDNTSGYSTGLFWVKADESRLQQFGRTILLGQAG